MKRWIYIAVGILTCANLFAQDSLGVRKIGDIGDWFREVNDLEVVGNYVYMLVKGDGLQVHRLPSGSPPVFVSRNLSLNGERIRVLENWGIIWKAANTIVLADLGDPVAPSLVSEISTPDLITDVEFFGGHFLGIASHTSGLRVYDISIPTEPVMISTLDPPSNVWDLELYDNYLYLSGVDSLRIIDISTPESPEIVRSIPGGSRIASSNGWVYSIVWPSLALKTYSLADPVNPVQVGPDFLYSYHDDFHKMSASNGILGISVGHSGADGNYDGEYVVIDVARPDSGLAVLGSTYWGDESATDLSDSAIVVWSLTPIPRDLKIFRISENREFMLDHETELWGYAGNRISLSGSLLFCTRRSLGFDIYSVNDPARPEFQFAAYEPDVTWNLTSSGPVAAYMMDGDNRIFNVSDPQAPVRLSYDHWDDSECQVLDYPFLFTGCCYGWSPARLRRFMVDDQSEPQLHDEIDIPAPPLSLVVSDSLLYIREQFGLLIVDFTGEDSMTIRGHISLGQFVTALAVEGSVAVLGGYSGWIWSVDVSNPDAPALLDSIQLNDVVQSVTIQDQLVYVANRNEGLRILNARNPLNLHEIAYYSGGFLAEDVAVSGDYAYLANYGQVFVLDVSEANGSRIPATPQQLLAIVSDDASEVLLTWLPVITDRGGRPIAIDAYEICRRYSSDDDWENIGVPTPPNTTQFTVQLLPGTSAFAEYMVRAIQW